MPHNIFFPQLTKFEKFSLYIDCLYLLSLTVQICQRLLGPGSTEICFQWLLLVPPENPELIDMHFLIVCFFLIKRFKKRVKVTLSFISKDSLVGHSDMQG